MWCIPPQQDAGFVAQMEQVLQVYARPYDPKRPVVCMDEQPKQLVREAHPRVTTSHGEQRIDHEYVRQGVCDVWMFTEPLGGWRDVRVTDRRTAVDWARQVRALVDAPRYRDAERITLVCDNLNTHRSASLYEAFEPAEALRIADRLELVHTPKHGSWLNIAECELSVLTRQCLSGRIADAPTVRGQSQAWSHDRNTRQAAVDWQFTTANARIKLKRLYPKIVG
jgi:DDE superfamily endonuclease